MEKKKKKKIFGKKESLNAVHSCIRHLNKAWEAVRLLRWMRELKVKLDMKERLYIWKLSHLYQSIFY